MTVCTIRSRDGFPFGIVITGSVPKRPETPGTGPGAPLPPPPPRRRPPGQRPRAPPWRPAPPTVSPRRPWSEAGGRGRRREELRERLERGGDVHLGPEPGGV